MTMELAESSVPEVKLINMESAMEIPEDNDVVVKKIDSNIEYEGRVVAEDECLCVQYARCTLPHVAPEILTGEPVSMVTDVWSLGVLLYIL